MSSVYQGADNNYPNAQIHQDAWERITPMILITSFLFAIFDTISGVVLISGALCADAVIGNVQEKTMKQYSVSNAEVVSQFMPNAEW